MSMSKAKVMLQIDESLVEEAESRVGRGGLSGYVSEALQRQLQHDRIRELLNEMDRESGPVGAQHLILDSGAVIALSRNDKRDKPARAYLQRAVELGLWIHVPVPVVAETLRGHARDAPVNRILNAIDSIPDATETVGRNAGALLGSAKSKSTIDALVVAQAMEFRASIVLTSDPDDLNQLASQRPEVQIQPLNLVS